MQIPRSRVALILCALLPLPAGANETIKPTRDVQDMRLMVTYVSPSQLAELQKRHGANVDRKDLRQNHRRGLSILKTNRETGARTCEIYLPVDRRPNSVDDVGTLTLGHELLHCMLGTYHR